MTLRKTLINYFKIPLDSKPQTYTFPKFWPKFSHVINKLQLVMWKFCDLYNEKVITELV
jgi:hypothetical protein